MSSVAEPEIESPENPDGSEAEALPLAVGVLCEARLRFGRDEVLRFAELSGDLEALDRTRLAIQRARHGEIIATGQQTAARMMGVLTTRLAQAQRGRTLEVLPMNFNFAFRQPVFAEQEVQILWRVRELNTSLRQRGLVALLDGWARVARRDCVVGRGTVRLRHAAE